MKTQDWSPDTCKCKVREEIHPDGSRTCALIIRKCDAHLNVADSKLYGVLYQNDDSENKTKNRVVAELMDDGETIPFGLSKEELKECECYFTGEGENRELHVKAPLKYLDKRELEHHCQTCMKRKVIIE